MNRHWPTERAFSETEASANYSLAEIDGRKTKTGRMYDSRFLAKEGCRGGKE